MDATDPVLAILERIAKDAERTRRAIEALCVHLGVPRGGAQGASARSAPPPEIVVSDAALDDARADRKVNFDPHAWTNAGGSSWKGGRMSDCPPEFLDAYAVALDEMASRQTDEKKAGYDRLDAARARAWARRKRTQGQAAPGEEF